jgi:haloacetate dehalogenase
MAQDCLALMRALGHSRFAIAGHDRGGRVAYRLALDHPEAVAALAPIDIIPTGEAWRRANAAWAVKTYHWSFLAQPHPLPETLIGKDPVYYLEHTLKSWARPRDLSPFSAGALAHYRALMQNPASVHAICEDYRAGAGIDRKLDDADLAAGRRIACPTLVLSASNYLASIPLDIWRPWCTEVQASPWPQPFPRGGIPPTRWRPSSRSSPPLAADDDRRPSPATSASPCVEGRAFDTCEGGGRRAIT